MNNSIHNVESYINSFPDEVSEKLSQIRSLIRELAPEAEEGFAYGMPAYKTAKKPLVYFAGFKNHIGFYALPSGHEKFKNELKTYKTGKGSVQFPLNSPLPIELITAMIQFRIQENLQIK